MNDRGKIVIKLILIVGMLFCIPKYNQVLKNNSNDETLDETSFVPSDTKSQNGGDIYMYNTHQIEKYATNSVKDGSEYLKSLLEKAGYHVDYETSDFELYKTKNNIDYKYSYNVSKMYLNQALKEHGKYDLVIDFHRDSVDKNLSTLSYDGHDYAKLLFVIGKNSVNHDLVVQESKKLSNLVNSRVPKLSRGTYEIKGDYNQQITSNMMLIEVGAQDNTFNEVKNTLIVLSDAIKEYLG